MRMSSFGTAISGLRSAQTGLYVTGHNMTNVDTQGYTRQRANQTDFFYNTVGRNGGQKLQVGLGSSVKSITQIRSQFLDAQYREQSSQLSFFATKSSTIADIEAILAELYGDGVMSDSINDLWKALQELSKDASGIAQRTAFISAATNFINKANDVYDAMFEEQMILNEQIIDMVDRINEIAEEIERLNQMISSAESSGDNANDYRDIRNQLLDELSSYVDIDIKEDAKGAVHVDIEGQELISNGYVRKLGLRRTTPGLPFVEPVWTTSKDILAAGTPAISLFKNLGTANISADRGNATGSLKAMMLARGDNVGTYMSTEADVANYTIPKLMREFDLLVNALVTMFNDLFSPVDATGNWDTANTPYDLNKGQTGYELFCRKTVDRYTGTLFNDDKTSTNWFDWYTSGNLCINPIFETPKGFEYLAFSRNATDPGDTAMVLDFLTNWNSNATGYSPSFTVGGTTYNFESYYKQLFARLGEEGSEAKEMTSTFYTSTNMVSSKRSAISDVAMDEELSNMLIYQHAYNAATRIFNIIDSMMETIIRL